MKKIVALMSVIALGAASAMAQGTIAFANNNSQPLRISAAADGSNSSVTGTNSQSVSLGAGPGLVTIRLYVGTNGAPVSFDPLTQLPIGLVLVGSATSSASTLALAQGTFSGGNPYTLPAPFDGSFAIEYVFWAETTSHAYAGHSVVGTGYTPATGINTPGATFGAASPLVQSFTLIPVPEPTSIALGGLGVAALLLFRRKK